MECSIPSRHPAIAWLVEHVADVITKYQVGSDGRTGYERLYGKKVREEGLQFGERVYWRHRKYTTMNADLEPRWSLGTWLGWKGGGLSHRASCDGEVIEARAGTRRPLADRWHTEDVQRLAATPWANPAPRESPDGEPPALLPPRADAPAGPAPAQP